MTPGAGKRVALTFDDLPAVCPRSDAAARAEVLARLAGELVRLAIPATGFAIGESLRAEPVAAAVRAWAANGFGVGNHSYTHPSLEMTPLPVYEADVLRADDALRALGPGIRGRHYFRPPYLQTGSSPAAKARLARFLRDHGLVLAPVTVTASDWVFAQRYNKALERPSGEDAEGVAAEFLEHARACVVECERLAANVLGYQPPQIMLLHSNPLLGASIGRVVQMLTSLGYTCVALEEALADPAYQREDLYLGPRGPTWLRRWQESGESKGATANLPAGSRQTGEPLPHTRQISTRVPLENVGDEP